VVTVIALLVVLGMGLFKGQLFKGRDARRKSDINRIQVAVEEYEKDHDCYPAPDLVRCDPGTGLSPYINKVPCDPATHENYYYEPENSACPSWYLIFAKLENTNDSDFIPGIGLGGSYSYVAGSPNAPIPTPSATPVPTPSGSAPPSNYWGCKSGICVLLSGRDECSPNYASEGCSEQCGTPEQPLKECVPLQ